MSVPSNWDEVENGDGGVTYAPDGGFFEGDNGGTAFTHGVQIGVAQGGSGNLQRDTQQLLEQLRALEPGSAAWRECAPRKHRRPHRADDAAQQRVGSDR